VPGHLPVGEGDELFRVRARAVLERDLASQAFSPRDAWKIDFDSDRVSWNSGLCRACRAASSRSFRFRSAVACGSAASSFS
jgi:hypothetical protein